MSNITKINTWQMISKDGRLVWITYDSDSAPLGVTEHPSPPSGGTWDTNLDVYCETGLNPMLGFVTEEYSAWATANSNIGPSNNGRIQFQDGNGNWITEYFAMSFFRPIPTGDGFFVLQGYNGSYVAISTTLDTIPSPSIFPMGLWANDLASAARFYAVRAATSTRLPVLDFLQLYNNASGLSFAGVGDQLVGMNLTRANLSLCDLTGVISLSGCNLSAANLQQAKLNEPNLAGACLSAADLTDAHLANCVFANLGSATNTTVVQPPINFYFQSDGITDCSVMDPGTLGFAFDFDSSGKRDHLVFYHPKQDSTDQKAIYIIKSNGDGTFTDRYSGDSIGEFDLTAHPVVRGFAFDFDSNGKCDHLVFYCPGEQIVYVFKGNGDGSFTQRYPTQANPVATGIGGYNLASLSDQGFAFDYEGTGKLDYLVFFRPAQGTISIIKSNGDGTFSAVYSMIKPGTGIAGCTFADPNTRGLAFDLSGSGKLDHLVFYYPTQNSIYIIQQLPGDTFTTVYSSAVNPPDTALPGSTYIIQHQRQTFTALYPNAANPTGKGLAGFNFRSPFTQCFAYDCEGSGKQNYLLFYIPGGYGGSPVAIIKINQGSNGSITYSQVFGSTHGLGEYDLANPADLGFAFDYNGTGGLNNITLYRPAHGNVAIYKVRGVTSQYPILEQAQLPGTTLATPMPAAKMAGVNLAGATLACDLSGADLSGGAVLTGATVTSQCDLTGANLSGAQMAGLDLRAVKSMKNVNLTGADLTGAKLAGVDLTGAILVGTKLCGIDLTTTTFPKPLTKSTDINNRTSFADSTLPFTVTGLDWSYLDLTGTTFTNLPTNSQGQIDLTNLNAEYALMANRSFKSYVLDCANFFYAVVDGCEFTSAKLRGNIGTMVNFNGASMLNHVLMNSTTLVYVDFTGVTLGGEKQSEAAVFSFAYLSSCKFDQADLQDVSFAGATLDSGNSFSSATNLQNANFSNAYLNGTDFSNAHLEGAKFDGAFMAQVDLTNAYLNPSDAGADGASLTMACLQGATFSNTQFQGADLSYALITDKVSSRNPPFTYQYYDQDGNLTPPFPLEYPANPFPAASCFDDSTICPNLFTYGANSAEGNSIEQMMTATSPPPPPTSWKPRNA
jgi:uncharacterized protein YjbI with pentapeptide repeats